MISLSKAVSLRTSPTPVLTTRQSPRKAKPEALRSRSHPCHFERSHFGNASLASSGVVRNPQRIMGLTEGSVCYLVRSLRTGSLWWNTTRFDH